MATKKVKEKELVEQIDTISENIQKSGTEIGNALKTLETVSEIIKKDEIFIETKGLIKLKPTKLKYFKDGSYNNFLMIKTLGINEVMRYEDGESVVKGFVAAALDVDVNSIDFLDDMRTSTLYELIEKMNTINEIKETDFFNQLQAKEVMSEKEE